VSYELMTAMSQVQGDLKQLAQRVHALAGEVSALAARLAVLEAKPAEPVVEVRRPGRPKKAEVS
jgi:hypothetical protein